MQEPAVETDHQHCWHVQQKMAYCDQKAEKIQKKGQLLSSSNQEVLQNNLIFHKFISDIESCCFDKKKQELLRLVKKW